MDGTDEIMSKARNIIRKIFAVALTLFFAEYVLKLRIPITWTDGPLQLIGDLFLLWGFIALAHIVVELVIFTLYGLIKGLVSHLISDGLGSSEGFYPFFYTFIEIFGLIGIVILCTLPFMKDIFVILGIIGIVFLILFLSIPRIVIDSIPDLEDFLFQLPEKIFSSIGRENY